MNDREVLKRARKGWELGSDDGITDLFDRFEQMLADKEPKSIVWEPKKGDEYFYSDERGILFSETWVGTDYELELLKHHNVYKTRELAEKAAPYQARYNMVLQAVMNLEPNQKVDWNDKEQSKYQPYFDYQAGVWRSWGKHYTQPLENGYRPLTDEKNVQPLLDYLNRKEQENG